MRESQGVPAKSLTVVLRCDVILGGVRFNQWPQGDLNRARGVLARASFCLMCITRLRKNSLGHNSASPVAPWPIFSSHAILLSGEGKDHEGGGCEVVVGGSFRVEHRASDAECDI